jgi:hypothetical protein
VRLNNAHPPQKTEFFGGVQKLCLHRQNVTPMSRPFRANTLTGNIFGRHKQSP